MKSWADYNSSDDEDGDDYYVEENKSPYPEVQEPLPPVDYPIDYSKKENNYQSQFQGDGGGNNIERQPQKERRRKSFVLPDRPPFTAFVGNLAFSVKNPDELGQRIAELTMGRFGKQIYVTASRVAIDRRDGKHKGFGYVEVETLEDLKAVLDLDDGNSIIAGRSIHLDVAQPQRPSQVQRSASESSWGSFSNRGPSYGSGEVDGSKFQGGRHILKRKESLKRQGSSSSDAPQQRPSLKLLPRRKDLDDKPNSMAPSNSASDIFGGAKPRDVNAIKPRDSDAAKPRNSDASKSQESDVSKAKDSSSSSKPQDPAATKSRDSTRKQDSAVEITKIEKPPHQQQKGGNSEKKSSRGGGRNSSGKGGRGGERGKGSSKSNRRDGNNNKDSKKQQKKEEPRKVSQILVKKVEPKPQPKPASSSNKFALLFDSDSDSD